MKKILNHLLTDILLFLVVLLTIIIIGRIILADDNIYSMVKDNIKEKISSKNIEEGVLKDFINEDDAEGISKYINENEFDEEFGSIISSYFKYTSGITDEKPNLNKFEKVIKEAVDKYEKETGKKIDDKKINQAINNMNKVIEDSKPVKLDKRVKMFLNFIYSDTTLSLIIILIIFIIAIKYYINKSIMAVIKSSAIVSSINTIFLIALSYIISIINNDNFLSPKTHKFFIKVSRNAAIIYLLLSIILFIILFINKNNEKILKNNKKEEIED